MVLTDQLLGLIARKRNAVKAQTRPHSFRTDNKLQPHFHLNELDKLHFCGPVHRNWLKSTVTEKVKIFSNFTLMQHSVTEIPSHIRGLLLVILEMKI